MISILEAFDLKDPAFRKKLMWGAGGLGALGILGAGAGAMGMFGSHPDVPPPPSDPHSDPIEPTSQHPTTPVEPSKPYSVSPKEPESEPIAKNPYQHKQLNTMKTHGASTKLWDSNISGKLDQNLNNGSIAFMNQSAIDKLPSDYWNTHVKIPTVRDGISGWEIYPKK